MVFSTVVSKKKKNANFLSFIIEAGVYTENTQSIDLKYNPNRLITSVPPFIYEFPLHSHGWNFPIYELPMTRHF